MKKTFLALVCLASLAWLTACTPEVKKIHLSDALMSGDEEIVLDQDGNAFTGEVWSDDDATFYMDVKDGQVLYIKTFHENGQLAILHEIADNEDQEDVFTYYDEAGNEMSVDDFSTQYPSVIIKMAEAWPDTYFESDEDLDDVEEP